MIRWVAAVVRIQNASLKLSRTATAPWLSAGCAALLQSLLWVDLCPSPPGDQQGTTVPPHHHQACLVLEISPFDPPQAISAGTCHALLWGGLRDDKGTIANTISLETHPTTHIQAWVRPHTYKTSVPSSTSFIFALHHTEASAKLPVSNTPEAKSTPTAQSYKHLMCEENRLIPFYYILHLGGQIN